MMHIKTKALLFILGALMIQPMCTQTVCAAKKEAKTLSYIWIKGEDKKGKKKGYTIFVDSDLCAHPEGIKKAYKVKYEFDIKEISYSKREIEYSRAGKVSERRYVFRKKNNKIAKYTKKELENNYYFGNNSVELLFQNFPEQEIPYLEPSKGILFVPLGKFFSYELSEKDEDKVVVGIDELKKISEDDLAEDDLAKNAAIGITGIGLGFILYAYVSSRKEEKIKKSKKTKA